MTDTNPGKNGQGDQRLRSAEGLFDRATAVLEGAIAALEGGGGLDGRDVTQAVKALNGAMQTLLTERGRFDKLVGEAGGGTAGECTLDLDAARREIRGRMARLRASRSAGEVSGCAE